MDRKTSKKIMHDHNGDGIDRRGFLECMAWAGTGAFCVMQGGVLKSFSMSRLGDFDAKKMAGELSFVQISDSHMGFNKPANPDVTGTLQAAVDKINGLPPLRNSCCTPGTSATFPSRKSSTRRSDLEGRERQGRVLRPGRARCAERRRQAYLERYGKNTKGAGWYSFDQKGVHFIGLVNVLNLKAGGLGTGQRAAGLDGRRREAFEITARRSWCSRTFRCGRCIRIGAGARRTARRRWAT